MVYKRFWEFGGWRLVMAYVRMGLLPVAFRQLLRVCMGKAKVPEAYWQIRKQIDPMLRRKYQSQIKTLKQQYDAAVLPRNRSNKIWFCWLQGMEHAPELVLCCYNSLRCYVKEKEIIVVTLDNYSQYVDIPPYIMDKYRKKRIPNALFSDILRLELLIKYGGTWIDATVLCTGSNYPPELLDCDLFMYHVTNKEGKFAGASNWFITACSNNKLLMVLRDVLYLYWKDMDCVIEYYIFHVLFYGVAMEYPDEIAAMPEASYKHALMLGNRIAEDYDETWMQKQIAVTWFHKLNYRKDQEARRNHDSYYMSILNRWLLADYQQQKKGLS